jgi:hypothetical protein
MKEEMDEILKIVSIRLTGKICHHRLSLEEIDNLCSLGFKCTNEDRCTILVRRQEGISICINPFGSLLVTAKDIDEATHQVNELKAKVL